MKFKFGRRARIALVAICAIIGGFVLAGCSEASASTAMCAFVVGDGQGGDNAKIHDIIYPGGSVNVGQGENVSYVPCNSRNYITNDNNSVGDRHTPTLVYTKTGVPIKVWWTAYWTLNENKDALTNFYALCFKYTCASDSDQGGSQNFSTNGWNGLLRENFGPSGDMAIRNAAAQLDDSIWQAHNPEQYTKLGETVSNSFADSIRATTGYSTDLFCGSGNSQWPNPNQPGQGTFKCSNVRVTIDRVERGAVTSDNTNGQTTLNNQTVDNAKQLYGPYWQQVLADQAIINACKAAHTVCSFSLPGSSPAPAAVPVG